LARLGAAQERLRERAAKDPRGRRPKPPTPDSEAKVNLTDPDSRVVRDYQGYLQEYNVQAVVTGEQVIVAAELIRDATDAGQLRPMLAAAQANLAVLGLPQMQVLLADAGYYSDEQVRCVGGDGPELLIATRSDRYRRQHPSPPRGRIPSGLSLRERMARRLMTKRGRRLYGRRRWMIEPVSGDVKENRGIRRLMRRGFAACASEWKLVAATHNLRKLYAPAGSVATPPARGLPPAGRRRLGGGPRLPLTPRHDSCRHPRMVGRPSSRRQSLRTLCHSLCEPTPSCTRLLPLSPEANAS